jgi:hypothetical protein
MLLLRVQLARPGVRQNGLGILDHMLMLHLTITERLPPDHMRTMGAHD